MDVKSITDRSTTYLGAVTGLITGLLALWGPVIGIDLDAQIVEDYSATLQQLIVGTGGLLSTFLMAIGFRNAVSAESKVNLFTGKRVSK